MFFEIPDDLHLLKNYYITGMIERKRGSNRPRSARTEENVSSVEELALSQKDQPQTHCSIRQISREIGIHQSSVVRIIHDDLGLKCLKKRRAQENDSSKSSSLDTARQKAAGNVPGA